MENLENLLDSGVLWDFFLSRYPGDLSIPGSGFFRRKGYSKKKVNSELKLFDDNLTCIINRWYNTLCMDRPRCWIVSFCQKIYTCYEFICRNYELIIILFSWSDSDRCFLDAFMSILGRWVCDWAHCERDKMSILNII